ncbi:MAG: hypothetical protein WBA57_24315 [Elainellaceae cyanobacterium]
MVTLEQMKFESWTDNLQLFGLMTYLNSKIESLGIKSPLHNPGLPAP